MLRWLRIADRVGGGRTHPLTGSPGLAAGVTSWGRSSERDSPLSRRGDSSLDSSRGAVDFATRVRTRFPNSCNFGAMPDQTPCISSVLPMMCRGTKSARVSVSSHVEGMNKQALRRIARDKLARGELPRHTPQRICVNAGSGEPCSLCGEAIHPPEPEYELHFAFGHAGGLGLPCRFHSVCHTIWEAKRQGR